MRSKSRQIKSNGNYTVKRNYSHDGGQNLPATTNWVATAEGIFSCYSPFPTAIRILNLVRCYVNDTFAAQRLPQTINLMRFFNKYRSTLLGSRDKEFNKLSMSSGKCWNRFWKCSNGRTDIFLLMTYPQKNLHQRTAYCQSIRRSFK